MLMHPSNVLHGYIISSNHVTERFDFTLVSLFTRNVSKIMF